MMMFSFEKGFSLIELLIVVSIIGILAAITLPSYNESVRKTNRAVAQGALLEFSQAMERQFAHSFSYLGQGVAGNDTGAPDATVFANEAPLDGDDKLYDLSIAAVTLTSYRLQATPKSSSFMEDDGRLEISSNGERCWYKDQDTSGGSCTSW